MSCFTNEEMVKLRKQKYVLRIKPSIRAEQVFNPELSGCSISVLDLRVLLSLLN